MAEKQDGVREKDFNEGSTVQNTEEKKNQKPEWDAEEKYNL